MVQGYDIDRWGIDPLTAEVFDQVDLGDAAKTTVTEAQAGDPQILSYMNYRTVNYWTHILIANALVHPSELVPGQVVLLPVQRVTAINKPTKTTTL